MNYSQLIVMCLERPFGAIFGAFLEALWGGGPLGRRPFGEEALLKSSFSSLSRLINILLFANDILQSWWHLVKNRIIITWKLKIQKIFWSVIFLQNLSLKNIMLKNILQNNYLKMKLFVKKSSKKILMNVQRLNVPWMIDQWAAPFHLVLR